jgi:raffinose/stachyose/melibiose transport system permease protein
MLFVLPALILYTVFMAMPLLNSLGLSFFTGQGFRVDTFVGLQNYFDLFSNPFWSERFWRALGHTCIFFAINMLVQNTIALLLAVLLASEFRGRDIFRAIVFLPTVLSVLVIGFLWTLILNPQWGAANILLTNIGLSAWIRPWLGDTTLALPVVALVSCWQWIGYPTILLMAGLLTIPEELVEAARVDGASAWTAFWRIRFPLLLPVVGLVTVLTFIGNFSAFDIVFAMEGAVAAPEYSTDLLGTLFYRTGIAGEHPAGIPNLGMGTAIATIMFLILFCGVSLWMWYSRKRNDEM